MNKVVEINPWCIAFVFVALAIVGFLLVHPLNCASPVCSSQVASLFSVILP
jgi:hypothetical protein